VLSKRPHGWSSQATPPRGKSRKGCSLSRRKNAGPVPNMKPTDAYHDLDSHISSARQDFENKLAELVEIPSVSMDPGHSGDCRRAGELARQYLESIGATAELVETPGNPVLLGRIETGAGHPTVTVYNHLDVQPADPAEWHKAPFTFFKEDGRYEGRGTT